MRLHWHRRDLRVADNLGLAAVDDETIPLFVFDEATLTHAGPPRVAFLLDALDALRGAYRDRGGDLLIARGDPASVVPAIAAEHGADVVTWCEDYSGLSRERDADVRRALDDAEIGHTAVHDAVLHEPGSITTNDGDPYKVFTYFSEKWHARPKAEPADAPVADDVAAVSGDPPPALGDLGFGQPEADVPPAGTEAARDLLVEFCTSDVYRYAERRDYPADECTSRLSPHLKFGTVGIREVYEETVAAELDAAGEPERESVREFRDQLAWREFYAQVLWDRPDAVSENYRSYERPIEWREDPEGLQAWKDGETGFPIVDAGMRQLRAEAHVHNRVRMIVASFLTKDLLIDWRVGYDWFREKLVDHDTANDSGGWQWAASTGTDPQPYFRVFNPMTQGERYDPDAEYVGRYVPELAGVTADVVHSWHELDESERQAQAPAYPEPIVDHAERRERAVEMFERARGGN